MHTAQLTFCLYLNNAKNQSFQYKNFLYRCMHVTSFHVIYLLFLCTFFRIPSRPTTHMMHGRSASLYSTFVQSQTSSRWVEVSISWYLNCYAIWTTFLLYSISSALCLWWWVTLHPGSLHSTDRAGWSHTNTSAEASHGANMKQALILCVVTTKALVKWRIGYRLFCFPFPSWVFYCFCMGTGM